MSKPKRTIWSSKTDKRTDGITVVAFANGKRVAAWGMKTTHANLAARLCACIEAGKACAWSEEYQRMMPDVYGRTLNADLRARGF